MKDSKEIKDFYRNYADKIQEKRFKTPYRIRRYVHETTHLTILKHINSGERVLEIGCGEGLLAIMMAKKGAMITATDISEKNLVVARELAKTEGVKIDFLLVDAESIPFKDNYFDVVVADNVLEHLPDFEKGLSEIRRVIKKRAVIALPTCFNLCAWCLLGRDVYWKITRRTPFAIFIGLVRVIFGLISNKIGVDEGYGGKKCLPHLLRFPWKMRSELKKAGFKIKYFEAVTVCLPYLSFLLPIARLLDKHKNKLILKDLGFGSIVVVEK